MRLKSRQLRRLINETVISGRGYQSSLLRILLAESAATLKLAGAAEKKYAIVRHSIDGDDYVMVVSKPTEEKEPEVTAAAVGSKEGKWWRLKYLHSTAARSTPLALVGALGLFKNVLVDLSVSKAADDMIKNYYEKEKDNKELVIPDADEERIESKMDEKFPWRRAGYLAPPGSEQIAMRSVWLGDNIVDELSEKSGMSEEEIRDIFAKGSDEGFQKLYDTEERTGVKEVPPEVDKKLQDAIKKEDVRSIALELHKEATEGDSGKMRSWVTKWVTKNFKSLVSMVGSASKVSEKRSAIKYLDDLVEALFSNEGREGVRLMDYVES